MVVHKSSSVCSYRLADIFGNEAISCPTTFYQGEPFLRRRVVASALATFSILMANAGSAIAADDASTEQTVKKTATPEMRQSADTAKSANAAPPANDEQLAKKLELMETRLKLLEAQLAQKDAAAEKSPGASQPATPSAVKNTPKSSSSGPWWASATESSGPASAAAAPTVSAQPLPAADTHVLTGGSILNTFESPAAGLSIGAYGEMKYGFNQNPLANGQWQNGFDASRVVLLPTYQITPNIIFNAEIEFEHAGTGFDADDKLHGTAEIEQVWIDFKIVDYFNVRSPGIDLIPIGYINEHHEPTQFYSVNRPELYNGLIPSTWKAPASSIYGAIADGWTYQVQASTSLEDFGDDFGLRGDNGQVPPGPYAAGINGQDALAFSLPVRGDFAQLSNTIAVAAQLNYSPPSIPGFSGSTSFYYSPNTTPRGAHGSLCFNVTCDITVDGAPLGDSSLAMFDSEFRYRIPDTGVELRAEGVYVTFGNPANLRANNDVDPTNNVGKSMYGVSGEFAYHIPLGTFIGSDWEAVPFYRYTYQNFQTAGFAGADQNLPNGSGQQQFHTTGFAVFPSPQVVLKATYQHVIDGQEGGAKADSVLGGVGFFF
jgi:hypothetical protein